jgi:hypothetical protein
MRKIVAVLALSAIALAACGGSSGSKSDSSSGDSDSFSKLFEQSRNATLKVTYSGTDENGTTGDPFTVAQDGPDKSAFITGDSEIIVNGTTAIQCSNLQSDPTCSDYPGGVAAARSAIAAATAALTAANAAITGAAKSNGVGKSSTSQIAGRTAECVTITPGSGIVGDLAKKLGGGSYESCLDKDTGVVLKWQVQGGNRAAGVIATKVEQPTDADFEAPAGSIATTVPDSTDSTDTTGGDGSTPTTACTPVTLPGGGTIPGLPCMPA